MTKSILDKTTTLNNGVKMPYFGLGVWQTDNHTAQNSVTEAIKNGYRLIDTAKEYGNQAGVGKGIREGLKETGGNRKDLFITTKVFNGDAGYDSTIRAFYDTLHELQLTYIDLYLIHWPVDGRYIDTWHALEKLYKDGLIRAIGISNFDNERLQDLLDHASITPAINQMEYNPLNQEKEIHEMARMTGIQLEAWSPLGGGEALNDPIINQLAEKYDKTAAQIILRWNYQQDVITIPKSTHQKRIIENSQIADFELSDEDVQKIQEMDQKKHTIWYDVFDWHNAIKAETVQTWDDTEEYKS
ncbi:aldo/keto reductase [Tetragenococcus halophilus]|uniref:aldo/keto reductase n=1 Tax=Tetragenococcus halophilus TaxID=51669 RepID=UPI000CAB36C7|nr:aldo/keto reductase [Tetragenococcus halophilus]GBD72038.1 aldo-keto reductase [Tetragenococcus halophilus subsp. halophilus]GBD75182.1 aldo-keto reductase [Tetragenococcus halophilus subsp. halophilus]GFK23277.1 glyoxal reductase [Tetragenococcus halophilus]GFK27904.1 glyoxal reductase [Tetragenococcus halophilus]GLL50379.1 glyoxal reductase [Tetragenococcus halophilus]